MNTRQMALLRPDQILAEQARSPVVYLPLGLLEWHGPHLPLGVDALNAARVAELAAAQTGGLILPPAYWGTERERPPEMLDWLGLDPQAYVVGMDFPANSLPSMYVSEELFALFIREQLRLAVGMGFRLVVIVSGHAAQNQLAVLERLALEFSAAGPARVLVTLPFTHNDEGVLAVGHASQVETSVMLALHPETVDLSRLPAADEPLRNADWAIVDYFTFSGSPTPERTVAEADDPRQASAEAGGRTLHQAAASIAAQVNQALQSRAKPDDF